VCGDEKDGKDGKRKVGRIGRTSTHYRRDGGVIPGSRDSVAAAPPASAEVAHSEAVTPGRDRRWSNGSTWIDPANQAQDPGRLPSVRARGLVLDECHAREICFEHTFH